MKRNRNLSWSQSSKSATITELFQKRKKEKKNIQSRTEAFHPIHKTALLSRFPYIFFLNFFHFSFFFLFNIYIFFSISTFLLFSSFFISFFFFFSFYLPLKSQTLSPRFSAVDDLVPVRLSLSQPSGNSCSQQRWCRVTRYQKPLFQSYYSRRLKGREREKKRRWRSF